jgi:hypothetical protein
VTALLLALYAAINPLRAEHLAILVIVGILGLSSRSTRDLLVSILPMALFFYIYDLMRLVAVYSTDNVIIEGIYRAEEVIFGWMAPQAGALGPVDLFRQHNHIFFDLLGGVWYALHIPCILLFGIYLWFKSRGGLPHRTDQRLHIFMWGFLVMCIVGLAFQAGVPVAPPWYVEQYGFTPPTAPVDGDPAGLARVDAWLGIKYFEGVYTKNAYVFGALPSLHVASPVWLALNVRHRVGRPVAWLFAGMMGLFAVYLTHHYILDIVAGVALAVGVYLLMTRTPVKRWPTRLHNYLHEAFFGAPSLHTLPADALERLPADPPTNRGRR